MTTPNKQQLMARATELYMKDQAHYPGLGETLPELTELKEAGFLDAAKRELMSNSYQDPKMVEEVYQEMGIEQKENLNTEKIEELTKQLKIMQAQVMAKLENIPDLAKKIEALSQSKNFKDLGEALKPVTHKPVTAKVEVQKENPITLQEGGFAFTPKKEDVAQQNKPDVKSPFECANCGRPKEKGGLVCRYCGAPVEQPKPLLKIPEFLKLKTPIKILDAFAGLMVFVVWVAASGWILNSFSLSWGLVVGLAIFWIMFIVVYRVVVGGILD